MSQYYVSFIQEVERYLRGSLHNVQDALMLQPNGASADDLLPQNVKTAPAGMELNDTVLEAIHINGVSVKHTLGALFDNYVKCVHSTICRYVNKSAERRHNLRAYEQTKGYEAKVLKQLEVKNEELLKDRKTAYHTEMRGLRQQILNLEGMLASEKQTKVLPHVETPAESTSKQNRWIVAMALDDVKELYCNPEILPHAPWLLDVVSGSVSAMFKKHKGASLQPYCNGAFVCIFPVPKSAVDFIHETMQELADMPCPLPLQGDMAPRMRAALHTSREVQCNEFGVYYGSEVAKTISVCAMAAPGGVVASQGAVQGMSYQGKRHQPAFTLIEVDAVLANQPVGETVYEMAFANGRATKRQDSENKRVSFEVFCECWCSDINAGKGVVVPTAPLGTAAVQCIVLKASSAALVVLHHARIAAVLFSGIEIMKHESDERYFVYPTSRHALSASLSLLSSIKDQPNQQQPAIGLSVGKISYDVVNGVSSCPKSVDGGPPTMSLTLTAASKSLASLRSRVSLGGEVVICCQAFKEANTSKYLNDLKGSFRVFSDKSELALLNNDSTLFSVVPKETASRHAALRPETTALTEDFFSVVQEKSPRIGNGVFTVKISPWQLQNVTRLDPESSRRGLRLFEHVVKTNCTQVSIKAHDPSTGCFTLHYSDGVTATQSVFAIQRSLMLAPWEPSLLQYPEARVVKGVYRGLRLQAGIVCDEDPVDALDKMWAKADSSRVVMSVNTRQRLYHRDCEGEDLPLFIPAEGHYAVYAKSMHQRLDTPDPACVNPPADAGSQQPAGSQPVTVCTAKEIKDLALHLNVLRPNPSNFTTRPPFCLDDVLDELTRIEKELNNTLEEVTTIDAPNAPYELSKLGYVAGNRVSVVRRADEISEEERKQLLDSQAMERATMLKWLEAVEAAEDVELAALSVADCTAAMARIERSPFTRYEFRCARLAYEVASMGSSGGVHKVKCMNVAKALSVLGIAPSMALLQEYACNLSFEEVVKHTWGVPMDTVKWWAMRFGGPFKYGTMLLDTEPKGMAQTPKSVRDIYNKHELAREQARTGTRVGLSAARSPVRQREKRTSAVQEAIAVKNKYYRALENSLVKDNKDNEEGPPSKLGASLEKQKNTLNHKKKEKLGVAQTMLEEEKRFLRQKEEDERVRAELDRAMKDREHEIHRRKEEDRILAERERRTAARKELAEQQKKMQLIFGQSHKAARILLDLLKTFFDASSMKSENLTFEWMEVLKGITSEEGMHQVYIDTPYEVPHKALQHMSLSEKESKQLDAMMVYFKNCITKKCVSTDNEMLLPAIHINKSLIGVLCGILELVKEKHMKGAPHGVVVPPKLEKIESIEDIRRPAAMTGSSGNVVAEEEYCRCLMECAAYEMMVALCECHVVIRKTQSEMRQLVTLNHTLQAKENRLHTSLNTLQIKYDRISKRNSLTVATQTVAKVKKNKLVQTLPFRRESTTQLEAEVETLEKKLGHSDAEKVMLTGKLKHLEAEISKTATYVDKHHHHHHGRSPKKRPGAVATDTVEIATRGVQTVPEVKVRNRAPDVSIKNDPIQYIGKPSVLHNEAAMKVPGSRALLKTWWEGHIEKARRSILTTMQAPRGTIAAKPKHAKVKHCPVTFKAVGIKGEVMRNMLHLYEGRLACPRDIKPANFIHPYKNHQDSKAHTLSNADTEAIHEKVGLMTENEVHSWAID